jgi:hypothetical protein
MNEVGDDEKLTDEFIAAELGLKPTNVRSGITKLSNKLEEYYDPKTPNKDADVDVKFTIENLTRYGYRARYRNHDTEANEPQKPVTPRVKPKEEAVNEEKFRKLDGGAQEGFRHELENLPNLSTFQETHTRENNFPQDYGSDLGRYKEALIKFLNEPDHYYHLRNHLKTLSHNNRLRLQKLFENDC